MRSLGLSEKDWLDNNPILPGVEAYREAHYALFRDDDCGIEMMGAVIFGMERTTPYRHQKVVEGLKKFSARTGLVVNDEFFAMHVEVDDGHNWSLITAVQHWFRSVEKVRLMRLGARLSF